MRASASTSKRSAWRPSGWPGCRSNSISGLSPSISIDQHLTNRSPRSTVGTATDVYTYLRVLYARLGRRPCPNCGMEVPPAFDPQTDAWEGENGAGEGEPAPEETFACPHCGAPVPVLSMASFSFNKPEGACPACTGLGRVQQVRVELLLDEEKSLAEGAVLGWNKAYLDYNLTTLQAAAEHYGLAFDPSLPVKDYSPALRDLLLYGVESPSFQRHFPGIEPPALVRQGRFEGLATSLLRRYAEHSHDADYRQKLDAYLVIRTCPDCQGTRLRPASRAVTVDGRHHHGSGRSAPD